MVNSIDMGVLVMDIALVKTQIVAKHRSGRDQRREDRA